MARPRSALARQQMLQAAQELLAERGVTACTADEIAQRSGVAKTTMYRHFGSIDELVVAALQTMIEEVALADHGSLRADLRAAIVAFRQLIGRSEFRRVFVSMMSRSLSDPEYARVFREAQRARHAPLRVAIQRGYTRGEVDPSLDLDQTMYFVQGPFIAMRLIEEQPLTDDDIEVFLDLICRAVAPPKKHASDVVSDTTSDTTSDTGPGGARLPTGAGDNG